MRVIIAGSRKVADCVLVFSAIRRSGFIGNISEVVSGCARGVDHYGQRWAELHGIPVRKFPANWDEHGFSAGPIRNREMAAYADALILVWNGESKGSASMLEEAKRAGLLVYNCVVEKGHGLE